MAACAPQRFLAGNRNAIRDAILTPSSVLPVENAVLAIPTSRNGTAQVALTGNYAGAEEATYDVEVLDADVEVTRVSAPVFTGEGSGTIEDISADVAEDITVELSESGLPLLAAEIDFEGVTVKARTAGAAGNAIHFQVDQTTLFFAAQPYSLLNDLEAGAGAADSPMTGAEFDFDTKILGADGQIPTDAHRISFGVDPTVYLQYKVYEDNRYKYHLVPELKHAVPKGTVVNFVTGGRTVTVYPGSPPETYTDIVTLYDLLNKLKTESQLVDVDGIVANDRSPTGQAAHELATRTDAYAQPSSGDGSESATEFENVTVEEDAGTQLVVAKCVAVTAADHPLAGIGRTRWELRSSILGSLGIIIEGEAFAGAQFGLTVPRRLPYAVDQQVGNFTVTAIEYATRAVDEEPPPICPGVGQRAGLLGPSAIDQTLELVYTKRPDGDCACDDMPTPNLDTECLGNEGISEGEAAMYQDDTIARVKALREWYTARVRANSSRIDSTDPSYSQMTQDEFISAPLSSTLGGTLSLREVVDRFEQTIALIDPLTPTSSPSLRSAGCLAWDDALGELQGDIAGWEGAILQNIPSDRYVARLGAVLAAAGLSALGGADASTVVSGDGCWRDWGDAYYWTVVGSDKGAYAPTFTNHPYYSTRRADDKDAYYSTHEFAFQINVKCPDDLREGDTIRMSINAAARPSMYQVGDTLSLPIIGAHDLYLAGGQDSSLVQAWYVTGNVSGPFPPYAFNPDAPSPYSTGSPSALSFLLVEGGIPFAKGDRFKFSIEGGHYQWRINGGAWNIGSPPEPIPEGTEALDAGLFVTFTGGAAPSFVANDRFSFRALQPWAVSNLQNPTVERWRWNEASPTLVADLGTAQDLDMAAIALHTIPAGATITLEGGTAPGVYLWTETLTWREGVIAHLFAATRNARYLRLSLTAAAGGGIGWFWAGLAFQTSRLANVTPHRSYKFARGDGGLNTRGRFLGKGRGADVEWPEAALEDDDMAGLADMLDWVKEHDDEPLVFLSQVTRPEEAMLVNITDDEIAESDLGDGNRDASVARKFSARLSLGAFLQ